MTESGVTVFGPFAADTDYFAADKAFMLNFRVADLDAETLQGFVDEHAIPGAQLYRDDTRA